VNAKDLLRYKTLLLAKRDELSAVREGVVALVPPAGESEGDLIDQANSDAEAELQISMRQSNAGLLRAIEDALVRIRQETYGVCEGCEQQISKARLEAVPWTHLCRHCKEQESA
jgi:DnaK suppressor protein